MSVAYLILHLPSPQAEFAEQLGAMAKEKGLFLQQIASLRQQTEAAELQVKFPVVEAGRDINSIHPLLPFPIFSSARLILSSASFALSKSVQKI